MFAYWIVLLAFWGVQLAMVGLIVSAARRPEVGRRAQLLLLTGLPFILCLLWGWRFKVEPGSPVEPSIITEAPFGFFLASVVISIGLVLVLRGARAIAVTVGLVEVASAYLVALLATMQVTGDWI